MDTPVKTRRIREARKESPDNGMVCYEGYIIGENGIEEMKRSRLTGKRIKRRGS
jgi:hypothetical protein